MRRSAESSGPALAGLPIRSPADAVALAEGILSRPGLRLVGLMAYESQIAGVGDNPPGRPLYAQAIRLMQRKSAAELADRRAAIVAAIRRLTPLEFVNGGGTGSLEGTSAEPAVTEIGAGSGLYHPTLFDAYRGFTGQPAAMFALPVVRRPGPGAVTALGGGYPASGPGAPSRVPSPYLPAGLRLDKEEGAGEVQTPLIGPAADSLKIGDKVWMRHAKAGELCERFSELHLVEGDDRRRDCPDVPGRGPDLPVGATRTASAALGSGGRSASLATRRPVVRGRGQWLRRRRAQIRRIVSPTTTAPTAAAPSCTSGRATCAATFSRSSRTLFAGLTRSARLSIVRARSSRVRSICATRTSGSPFATAPLTATAP